MRAILVALAVAGCAAPHPGPTDPRATQVHAEYPRDERSPPYAYPARADIIRVLSDAFPGETTPDDVVTRIDEALRKYDGRAYIDVAHEGHEHHYVLQWIEPLRTLVFLERTGDGVENLRATTVHR